jgi:hypothetical protein
MKKLIKFLLNVRQLLLSMWRMLLTTVFGLFLIFQISAVIFIAYALLSGKSEHVGYSRSNIPLPEYCQFRNQMGHSSSALQSFTVKFVSLIGPLHRDPIIFRLPNSGGIESDEYPSLSVINKQIIFKEFESDSIQADLDSFSFRESQGSLKSYPTDFIIFTEDKRVSDVQDVIDAIKNYFDGKICGQIFVQMDPETFSGLDFSTTPTEVFD